MTQTTTLLIARHGNTFRPEETPTRVGARTDLDLVPTGEDQAHELARYLAEFRLIPDVIFTSYLKRTIQMAEIICDDLDIDPEIIPEAAFNEIDYGPDENKTEEEVIARLGLDALKKWDLDAVVPDGWIVHPEGIIQSWADFAADIEEDFAGQNVLVITSNGIARFAPYLTGDFNSFKEKHGIKIATGALCVLNKIDSDAHWTVDGWNIRPKKVLDAKTA
ncbi:MAG: histidine phosphatase family protein [Pseudobdellovibrionaceae bacterium]